MLGRLCNCFAHYGRLHDTGSSAVAAVLYALLMLYFVINLPYSKLDFLIWLGRFETEVLYAGSGDVATAWHMLI